MRSPILSIDYRRFFGQLSGTYIVREGNGVNNPQQCRTRVISTDLIVIDCDTPGPVGAKWMASFPELGLLSGTVLRLDGPKTVVLQLSMGDAGKERLAATIRWLVRRGRGLSKELRRSPRVAPRHPHTQIRVGSEVAEPAIILDISSTGAKVSSSLQLMLGSEILVGSVAAKVVRSENNAYGVEFTVPLQDSGIGGDLRAIYGDEPPAYL